MNRSFLEAHFYETYHFASCVRNILHDRFAYIRHLNDFYGDDLHLSFVPPFRRHSAFHSFLDFVIGSILTEDTETCDLKGRQKQMVDFAAIPAALADMKPDVLPIEQALEYHGLSFTPFTKWLSNHGKRFEAANADDVIDYLDHLAEDSVIDTLREQAVRETFYVLFGNRHLLMLFNQMMADQVSQTIIDDLDPDDAVHFRKDGVLRRVPVPRWVQRCVFYRDRGLCTFCGRDLSGTVAIWSEDHFDHIVPLNNGGLNDVTNIQLLCADCNRRKSDERVLTSSSYEDWYPVEYM